MGKSQSSVKPQCRVYGGFKKAIKFSNPLEQSSPSPPPLNYPNSPEHPNAPTKPVPIEFDHSLFSKIRTNQPVRTGGLDQVEDGGKKIEPGSNGQFSDYIKRAKMKMRRSMTVAGGSDSGGKGVSRLESINKNMSAYIDRAKVKMRTASAVGARKKPD